jgi:hypothetical protein
VTTLWNRIARGRRPAALAVAVALTGPLGCRRQQTPEVPEVWDETAAPERTDALGALAPPWPAPAKARLDSGLLTFWLHEPNTPALHVRVLFPIGSGRDASPDRVAVVGEALRAELRRHLARYDVEVEVEHQPGRIEVALHGRHETSAQVFSWLTRVLGNPDPESALVAARDRLRARTEPPSTEELAATTLLQRLMALPSGPERIEVATLERLSLSELRHSWDAIVDPRRSVLVVHAGHAARDARKSLAFVSSGWEGNGRHKTTDSTLERLRPRAGNTSEAPRHLFGDPAPPIVSVPAAGVGGPVMILGRRIPTPTSRDRGLARLAQRVAQEEFDVRVSIAGRWAVVIVVIPLSGPAADASVQKAIDELSAFASTRQPRQRLFQAAQLWLGARVVDASLRGEDWTALWSQAIDLADEDATIGTALAREANVILGVDPDELLAWQMAWLDPRGGKPGWDWVVSGVDRKIERQLSRFAQILHQGQQI